MKKLISPSLLRLGRTTLARIFKPDVSTEVRDELEFHVEMRVRDLVREGMDEAEARVQAQARFGDLQKVRADLEDIGTERDQQRRRQEMWTEVWRDVRYAFRQLGRSPGFALVATVTLALGIGANSAVFSVVNGVLFRPFPYENAEELVNVTTAFPTMNFERFWLSPPEFFELREWNQVFEEVGGYRTGVRPIETLDRPTEVVSAVATYTLFSTLGVQASMGRTFTPEEDLPGADPVIMISTRLWQTAFGGDPEILGTTVRVAGVASTVVGVLPEDFDLDDAGVDLLQPTNIDPNDHVQRRGNHFLNVVGRLLPGVSLERVQADLDRLEVRWNEEFDGTHTPSQDFHPVKATDFRADALGDVSQAMILLMGAVFFVLLIACANVANLLLAKAQTRSKEVAVRVAMGAGRARLVRQLLSEGLVLSLVGGVFGLVLGQVAVRILLSINPEGVPRSAGIGLDGRVVVFTMGVALLTGVVFGLAPLLNTTLRMVADTLREGGTRTTRSGAGLRARRLLVVAEMALAVILVTGSGLMVRSMSALQAVELGFDADNLLTMRYSLSNAAYPELHEVTSFQDRFLDRVRALPGVVSASAVSGLPPIRSLDANDTGFEGVERTENGPAHNVDYWSGVEEDYVETMGITVLEGRAFEPQDALAEAPVAMVNRRLAETFYPGQSPLGRRVRPGGSDTPWFTIIGVVDNVPLGGIGEEPGTELLLFNPQLAQSEIFAYRTMNPVVRVDGDPMRLAPQVGAILREMDPSLALSDVQSMSENVSETMAAPRFMTLLMAVFAGVALLLAAIGTYGVMSYTVAERNREIGIRMAMGAPSRTVQGMVLKQGAILAGVGLVIGVGGALSLSRFLASQLFQVSDRDPVTFLVAPAFLAMVALLACFVPARRATRVDPAEVLGEA